MLIIFLQISTGLDTNVCVSKNVKTVAILKEKSETVIIRFKPKCGGTIRLLLQQTGIKLMDNVCKLYKYENSNITFIVTFGKFSKNELDLEISRVEKHIANNIKNNLEQII